MPAQRSSLPAARAVHAPLRLSATQRQPAVHGRVRGNQPHGMHRTRQAGASGCKRMQAGAVAGASGGGCGTNLGVEHHLQQRVQHHVVGDQLAAVNDGLHAHRNREQPQEHGSGRQAGDCGAPRPARNARHTVLGMAGWAGWLRVPPRPRQFAACWRPGIAGPLAQGRAGRAAAVRRRCRLALMSGLVSSSCDMPIARLSPRLFMMNGMLVPLPEPGAPLSQTTSRGQTRRCGARHGGTRWVGTTSREGMRTSRPGQSR